MADQYPYQTPFEIHLKNDDLAPLTLKEYRQTLSDFFNYLSEFNDAYMENPQVNALFDRDVEQYLGMVEHERHYQAGTYNKTLSHLNRYFKYLLAHQLIQTLPTLTIKGKPHTTQSGLQIKWLTLLPTILKDAQVSYYTRATLLLISKRYPVNQFLTPGFAATLDIDQWTQGEQAFWQQFLTFLAPIQLKQRSQDLFLKQRFHEDPHLTLPGLHKYLKSDAAYLGFAVIPSQLSQSVIVAYILQHLKATDTELSEALDLDPASLSYYRQLARRISR